MTSRPRVVAYLLVNVATLLWGGNVVLGRGLRHVLGPWTLGGVRAALASLLFLTLVVARRRSGRGPRDREWLLLLAMAVTGVIGFQVLQYAGLRHTTAINAGLVNGTAPLITLVFGRVLVGSRLNGLQVAGAVISLFGVGAVVTQGSLAALWQLRLNPGDLLVLAAVCCWALYSLVGQAALHRLPTLWVTACSTAMAVPLLAGPAALEVAAAPPPVTPEVILGLLYIGAGPSFLAFLAWNEGVRRLGPAGAMSFYNTLPLYAGLLAAGFLGETPGFAQLGGGVLVVGGCLMAACSDRGATPDRKDG